MRPLCKRNLKLSESLFIKECDLVKLLNGVLPFCHGNPKDELVCLVVNKIIDGLLPLVSVTQQHYLLLSKAQRQE